MTSVGSRYGSSKIFSQVVFVPVRWLFHSKNVWGVLRDPFE